MRLLIDDKEIPVIWENNKSVLALMEEVNKTSITIKMSMYSNNEQVGSLARQYPTSDCRTTTHYGDIVLYLKTSEYSSFFKLEMNA
ncbi:MAG: cyclophilin-like fold protein [Bacillota bacterium]|nr:cyclophilin-like fold protein [Bacillota bacterium]